MSKRKDWKFDPQGNRKSRGNRKSQDVPKRRPFQEKALALAAEMFKEIILSDMAELADMVVGAYEDRPTEIPAAVAKDNDEFCLSVKKYIEQRLLQNSPDDHDSEATQLILSNVVQMIGAFLVMQRSPVLGFFLAGNEEAVMGVFFNKFAVRVGLIDPENPPTDPSTKLN